MRNLVCFSHPKYSGEGAPMLSCKTCCAIYISAIKAMQVEQQNFNAKEWLEEKTKVILDHQKRQEQAQAREELPARSIDFFPGSI